MSQARLTVRQRQALARLEVQYGPFDYMCGGKPKPFVFVDFNVHSGDYRSFRIARDGETEDVTAAMLPVAADRYLRSIGVELHRESW